MLHPLYETYFNTIIQFCPHQNLVCFSASCSGTLAHLSATETPKYITYVIQPQQHKHTAVSQLLCTSVILAFFCNF